MSDGSSALLPAEPAPNFNRAGERQIIYPRRVKGPLTTWRTLTAGFLILVFTGLPHLQINGLPAILLDIPAGRFAFFGTVFFATDTLLLGLLIIAILITIVLITALFGRIWCGWACPQTIYLDFIYRAIEQWLEGHGHAQRRFNEAPWTPRKVAFKTAKWGLYLATSIFIAHTFLAYFVGVETLTIWMQQSPLEHPFPFIVMATVTGAMMFDFGWFREQMCTILCPYGRLQTAMIDDNTLRIAYDYQRGEPRGKLQRRPLSQAEFRHGDCVDCSLCQQVCPSGIDIRDGFQLECIACTRCIDVCNGVMDKLDRDKGLIRHASTMELRGRRRGWWNPRTIAYGLLWMLVTSGWVVTLASRPEAKLTVVRAIDRPYQILQDGLISNHLRVRVANLSVRPQRYRITLVSPTGGKLVMPIPQVDVDPGTIGTVDAFVLLETSQLVRGRQAIRLKIDNGQGLQQEAVFTFIGPGEITK